MYKNHKSNCQCCVCKSKRYEPQNHRTDCQCCVCKSIRREKITHIENCTCCICRQLKEEDSPRWAGDNVGRGGIHLWIKKHYGRAAHCENPMCTKVDYGFEWAKIDHNAPYVRDKKDYMQLCRICHRGYDTRKIMINGRYGK